MQFTKLRLTGFKSFVDPTDVLIEPGLTGIVGPNGCGKSNLVEALRWVMGENSYKSMRASGMEDVIFSGTTGRPARNSAEVMLTIDNKDRKAPASFNEDEVIEVARRIERDMGSDYRINGKEVRARDVQMLFADASSGSRSPAMVRQGMISELINAKPQSRRRILEEAAGISGLNARRHETETRLKAAETNLARVEDVIKELAAQLDNIKKQAKQAIRYRTLSTDIRELERKLFARRWHEIGQLVEESESALKAAEAEVLLKSEAQAEAGRNQAVASAGIPALREKEAEAAAALQRLISARDALSGEKQRAEERMREIVQLSAQADSDTGREQQLAQDAQDAIAKLDTEIGILQKEEAQVAGRAQAAEQKLRDAETKLNASEEALTRATEALAEANARKLQIQKRIMEFNARIERLAKELSSLAAEREKLQKDQGKSGNVDLFSHAAEQTLSALKLAEDKAHAAEEKAQTARAAEEKARSTLNLAESAASKLEIEAQTLEKLVLGAEHGNWQPVLEQIKAEKGYEIALSEALGELLSLPLDARAPRYWAAPPSDENDQALPQGARPLSEFVKAPAQLARALSQIGVIEAAAGEKLKSQLKPGQKLVAKTGEMWSWEGIITRANAPSVHAVRLAEKNRLQELAKLLGEAKKKLEAERAAYEKLRKAAEETALEEQESRKLLRAAQTAASAAQVQFSEAERGTRAASSRLAAIEATIQKLNADLEEAQQSHKAALTEESGDDNRAALEKGVAQARDLANEDRRVFGDARAHAQVFANEAKLRNQRLETIAREKADWAERLAKAKTQQDVLKQRKISLSSEHEKLSALPAALTGKEQALLSKLSEAESARKLCADELATAENGLRELDRAEKAALGALSEVREQRAACQARLEGLFERREALRGTIAETLDMTLEDLLSSVDSNEIAEMANSLAVEEKLERYKRERERLGAVNLRAEEEVRDLESRHEKLSVERNDLVSAIARLREGIQSLNREGRERLLAAFTVVNGHFQTLFTTLFGGGTAELTLTESDDPLEAGLEIVAHPPGKKPQVLSLLSGGEQALTALALIFAVFLTNPAPICVLDEVDAPLDDHNVERFCDLMDKMVGTTNTRFVIITHNPITMARMHRLYGVTMAERGVSQLVSVDLQAAERLVEAA